MKTKSEIKNILSNGEKKLAFFKIDTLARNRQKC